MNVYHAQDNFMEEIEMEEIINMSAANDPVMVTNNHIHFYGDVDRVSAQRLNSVLVELNDNLISMFSNSSYHDNQSIPIIHLHLSTDGGEIFAAFSIIETISRLTCKVYTYVEGCVASAGSLISCCGDRRFMGRYSKMLIHQLRANHTGKYADMQDNMENCQCLMNDIKEIYLDKTSFDEDLLEELLKREKYLTSEECVNYGLIDIVT